QQRGEGRRAGGGIAQHKDLLYAGAPHRLKRLVQKRAGGDVGNGEQELGFGVVELEGKLVGGVERIDGGDGASKHRDRQDGDSVFGQVGAVDCKDVALGEAALGQTRGDEPGAHGELAVGKCASAGGVDQRGLVSQLSCAL